MKHWQDFLDSLSTAGGNIVVLMVCSMGLTFLMLHLNHDLKDTSLVEMGKTTLAGFSGALLQALRSNASRQQMTDRNQTANGQTMSATGTPVDAPPPVILQPKNHGSTFIEVTK